MGPYKWLTGAARYYDMGAHRFVSRTTVLGYVNAGLQQSGNVMAALWQYQSSGTLGLKDWHGLMREEVKREVIRQYLLGIGGREQMTKADWGRVGAQVKGQYKYLDGFRKDIAAGKVSAGQGGVRAEMYANSARAAYERAHYEAQRRSDVVPVDELWVLGIADHCTDCLDYAALGWQPVGTFPFPGDGSTICLSNCHCHKEYRGVGPDGEEIEGEVPEE